MDVSWFHRGGAREIDVQCLSEKHMEASAFDGVIDVRTVQEWDAGHIANATFVANLASTGTPDSILGCQNCTLALYCSTGVRAGKAIVRLQTVYGFNGTLFNCLGVTQWTNAGYPLVQTDSVTPRCENATQCDCGCRPHQAVDTGATANATASSHSGARRQDDHKRLLETVFCALAGTWLSWVVYY